MKAVVYDRHGDASVLELVERPIVEPGPGEVRIRVATSGVNPTDCKTRSGAFGGELSDATIPNHDGAGVVDAVGSGVVSHAVGDRVWMTLAGYGRPAGGTAQEFTVVPVERVFRLPAAASFDDGASIGIPALTAHRALTVAEGGPTALEPKALDGTTVVVAGGAGAVGNAAIQLARWSGATVIATVSSPAKARLAVAAGAQHAVTYNRDDAAVQIRRIAPDGVDLIVEVAAGTNAALDLAVLKARGTISIYANDGSSPFRPEVGSDMALNARYQFVLLYTLGWDLITTSAQVINRALDDGGYGIGEEHGLPVHQLPLDQTVEAHRAVESRAVGKVLITVRS